MTNLQIGVIGLGVMGTYHAKTLAEQGVLAAVCDPRPAQMETYNDNVRRYTDEDAFFTDPDLDGVLIATPHRSHPAQAVKALERGLHVLIEKPAGVDVKSVREMNDAAAKSGRVFSIMFNQRMNPLYQKVRDLVMTGAIGEIRRTSWVVTDWYRPQSYYNSGGWRATWAGEGGGVMMNQAPHQLDLWVWLTGMMPISVQSFCGFGRHRRIEVEDEVTAYVEYENGATGVFVTSIAEAPGTNRLELVGTGGKLVVENGVISLSKLNVPEPEFNETCSTMFGKPESEETILEIPPSEPEHAALIQNWLDAIQHGTPLAAPGEDGINSLMITNAVYMSAWLKQPVTVPIDEDLYQQMLEGKSIQGAIKQ